MTRKVSRPHGAVLLGAAVLLMALSGCAQPVGQCEGGVSDLSTLSSVTVQNPC